MRLQEDESRITETMLYDGNDEDSFKQTKALENAVKRVTDPMMLSELMKTQSPYVSPYVVDNKATTESKRQRMEDKENLENICPSTKSPNSFYIVDAEKRVSNEVLPSIVAA